jgi:probable phosphomutase (TIGR03848 family)
MTQILLVRHGQNEWVNKKRLAGWIPSVHLNEEGMEQVSNLSQRLVSLPIKAIFSSPLERCIETAQGIAAAQGLEVIESDQFGEVRYGEWEGKKVKKLAKKRSWYAVQHYPSRFQFPSGEALRAVQQRAVDAIEDIAALHQDEMVVIVSHADVIKLVLAYYLGMHIDLFQRIGLSPASVSVLALSKNGPVGVLRINDDGPIKPPKEPEAAEHKNESDEG